MEIYDILYYLIVNLYLLLFNYVIKIYKIVKWHRYCIKLNV